MSRKGFTLLELVVYIVIATIIVGLAGSQYYEATKLRLSTMDFLESSQGATEVIGYLEEDLRRLGAKGYVATTGTAASLVQDVFIAPTAAQPDSSSFVFTNAAVAGKNHLDGITFRYAHYQANGTVNANQWREIKWKADAAGNLWRTVTRDENGNALDSVRMATGVDTFNLDFGVRMTDSNVVNLSALGVSNLPPEAGTTLLPVAYAAEANCPSFTGFTSDAWAEYVLSDNGGNPLDIEVKGGQTYKVEFDMGATQGAIEAFMNDSDFVAVALRKKADHTQKVTEDFQFYLGMSAGTLGRTFHFVPLLSSLSSGSDPKVNAHLIFRFRIHKIPATSQIIWVKSLRLSKISHANYEANWKSTNFGSSPAELRKKGNTKAIRVTLSVGEKGSQSTIQRIIPITNNGVGQ